MQNRLMDAGVLDQKLQSELDALWKYGVSRIQDTALRETIEGFLCIVPVIFFIGPASRSGHLHPPWQHGRYGTLRSIIESCVLVPAMAHYIPELLDEDLQPDPYAIDIALGATIISDTWKKEDFGDIHYGPEHGRVAAKKWRKFAADAELHFQIIEDVAQGSIWHYGVYTPGWKPDTPLSGIAKLVNLCDAITAQPALALIYEGKVVIT
ncbi:MAG: hypothetical protein Q7R79_04725 [bacterium]|nr:hypothetical protein [bacterium]